MANVVSRNMIRNDCFGVRTTEGKELIRVRGVYMYVILVSGRVAALVGHKTLTVTAMEYPDDKESVMGYIRVGKWVYPLARAISPVVISEDNAIVMPDAFCENFEDAKYVAVKLPESMTMAQKKILEKVLGVFAHLKGNFKPLYNRSLTAKAPYIFTKFDKPRSRANSENFNFYNTLFQVNNKSPCEIFKEKMKTPTMRYRNKSVNIPFCIRPFKSPLVRLYTIGPQDPAFVTVDTTPVWVKINFILFRALKTAVNKLTVRFNYKKGFGIAPNFDARFGLYLHDVSKRKIVKPPINLVEDTDWAAVLFDDNLRLLNMELVDFEVQDDLIPHLMEHENLDQDLIVRHLMSHYYKTSYLFCTMVTVSEIETYREQQTKETPRIFEQCDHKVHPFTECYHE